MCVYAAVAGCLVLRWETGSSFYIRHNVYYLMLHWRWMHMTVTLIFNFVGIAHPNILLFHTMVCYLNIGLVAWIGWVITQRQSLCIAAMLCQPRVRTLVWAWRGRSWHPVHRYHHQAAVIRICSMIWRQFLAAYFNKMHNDNGYNYLSTEDELWLFGY